jgi:hypothetical protein
MKINGLVVLRNLKFVKEKTIIQSDARKSVNVSKSFISKSRIMNIALRLKVILFLSKKGS